jgi:CheY-like chemotaxis protein
VYGDRFALQVFRRLEAGVSPELELSRLLAARGSELSPRLEASVELAHRGAAPDTVAIVHARIPHAETGWEYTLQELGRYYDQALARPREELPPLPHAHPLDLSQRDPPPLVTRHSLREARHSGRILLVEDNGVNQLVARRLLEKRGHTVVIANNGREALAMLDDPAPPSFAVVLMDVQMPEMDGFECTAVVRGRELATGAHIPIIAMTAHAMKGDEAHCLAAGMDAYLSKPIQPDELFELVERYLMVGDTPASARASSPGEDRETSRRVRTARGADRPGRGEQTDA